MFLRLVLVGLNTIDDSAILKRTAYPLHIVDADDKTNQSYHSLPFPGLHPVCEYRTKEGPMLI